MIRRFPRLIYFFNTFSPPIGPKIYWKFSIIFNFPNFHVMYVAPRASSLISSYKGFTRLPLTHTRTHTRTGCNVSPRRTDRGPWSIGSSNILPYCWLNPFLRWWRAWTKWRRPKGRERERKVVRVSIFITWFNLTAIARTGDWWRFYTRLRGDKGNDEKVVYPLEINMDTFLSPPFSQGFFKGQIILDVWSKSFRIFNSFQIYRWTLFLRKNIQEIVVEIFFEFQFETIQLEFLNSR